MMNTLPYFTLPPTATLPKPYEYPAPLVLPGSLLSAYCAPLALSPSLSLSHLFTQHPFFHHQRQQSQSTIRIFHTCPWHPWPAIALVLVSHSDLYLSRVALLYTFANHIRALGRIRRCNVITPRWQPAYST